MKKYINNKIIIMLTIFGAILLIPHLVQAASFSVTSSKTSVDAGGTATITVKSDCVGRFNVSCKNGTVSKSAIWIENNSDSITVTAGKSDTTTVTITPLNPLSTTTGQDVELGAKSVSIKINGSASQNSNNKTNTSSTTTTQTSSPAQNTTTTPTQNTTKPAQTTTTPTSAQNTTKPAQTSTQTPTQTTTTVQAPSSNANLSNLGLRTYDFTGFKPNTTSYNVTVPNEVTSVSVYATVQDSGAKYQVSGNNNLDVGTNKVTITVTAADKKTTKNYYIYVARKASEAVEDKKVIPNVIDPNQHQEEEKDGEKEETSQENEENKEQEENKEKLAVTSIQIEGNTQIALEPQFNPETHEYVIILEQDLTSIPLKIQANQEDAMQKIEGNENLKEGENEVLITVTSKDESEKVEYKIKVIKTLPVVQANETIETVEPEKQLINEDVAKSSKWSIILIGVIILLGLIVCLIIFYKNRNKIKTLKTGQKKFCCD